MHAAVSLDDLRRHGPPGGDFTGPGLWSLLVSPSAEASAHFADWHAPEFDRAAGAGWSLAIAARPDRTSAEDGATLWTAAPDLQEVVARLAGHLARRAPRLPPHYLVLLDPRQLERPDLCLILPLGPQTLAATDSSHHAFTALSRCVAAGFEATRADPRALLPPDRLHPLLGEIYRRILQLGGHPILLVPEKPGERLGPWAYVLNVIRIVLGG